jgi:hypothetical protein
LASGNQNEGFGVALRSGASAGHLMDFRRLDLSCSIDDHEHHCVFLHFKVDSSAILAGNEKHTKLTLGGCFHLLSQCDRIENFVEIDRICFASRFEHVH